jgi:hypothetical protein
MSANEEGRKGEEAARGFLQKRGYKLFQADWIGKSSGREWRLFEVKRQEQFTPPPFPGHGLPLWQVKARLQFQEETGVVAVLLVWDTSERCWYSQKLDALENGEHIDTNGQYPRRVYNLNSFEKYSGERG